MSHLFGTANSAIPGVKHSSARQKSKLNSATILEHYPTIVARIDGSSMGELFRNIKLPGGGSQKGQVTSKPQHPSLCLRHPTLLTIRRNRMQIVVRSRNVNGSIRADSR
jgi:hypothetical protein